MADGRLASQCYRSHLPSDDTGNVLPVFYLYVAPLLLLTGIGYRDNVSQMYYITL